MGAPVRIAALARAMRDTAAERSGGFSRVDIVETGLRPGERLHEAPLPGPGAEASAEAGVFRLPVSGPGRAGGALLVAQLARLDGETNPARLRAEMLRLAGAAPSAQPSRGNADADGSRRTAAPRRTEPPSPAPPDGTAPGVARRRGPLGRFGRPLLGPGMRCSLRGRLPGAGPVLPTAPPGDPPLGPGAAGRP